MLQKPSAQLRNIYHIRSLSKRLNWYKESKLDDTQVGGGEAIQNNLLKPQATPNSLKTGYLTD